MPKSADVTRRRILNAAYVAFRRKGYGRVGVDEIAAAAKVTKRTLYYHFESKDELLACVLGQQHDLAVLTWDGFDGLTPRRMIEKMFGDLAQWASTPRWTGSGFSRLAMELADLPGHPARAIAKRHKALIETRLADSLARNGIPSAKDRAREVWLLAEGAMTCILIHGDTQYAEAAQRAALRLLEGRRTPRNRLGARGRMAH